MTVLCIFLAWKAKQIRDQKLAVDAILAADGRIHYEDDLDPEPLQPVSASLLRQWLNKRVGQEYIAKVTAVTLYPTREFGADEQVKMLAGIPYLRNLAIWPGALGKSTADENAPGGLTDDGLRYVAEHLPYLRHLSVTASPATADGLAYLEKMKQLESLQIGGFESQPVPGINDFLKRNPRINNP